MGTAYEEKLIQKITGGIGAIKRKEKTAAEAGLGSALNQLAKINPGQHKDLMDSYKEAIELSKK